MKVYKDSRAVPCPTGTEDMELINTFARTPLEPEQVYTFCVKLCDNEVDRDFERFPKESLEQLAPLFAGKTGIFDHQWSASGQKARIYRTEPVYEAGRVTAAGEDYVWLKGWAYMLRTPDNENLIAEIDGGIKQEVSVGCAVRWVRCSICGAELGTEQCGHRRGAEYGGKLCYGDLMEPTDAFEWSFVAVPAQRDAGVIKAFLKEEEMTLREISEQSPQLQEEFRTLQAQAELGRRWLQKLREKTVYLAGLAQPQLTHQTAEHIAEKLEQPELEALCRAYEKQLEEQRQPLIQLGRQNEQAEQGHAEFII